MVAMGQMLALLTGGFDLSVGTILAVTSVVGALGNVERLSPPIPTWYGSRSPVGMLAGFVAGLAIGVVNGVGVALFNVSPFMMTLGLASIGFGIALYLTGGVPVYGMPGNSARSLALATCSGSRLRSMSRPLFVAIMYVVLNWTRFGRYLYAVGGNHQGLPAFRHQHPKTLFLAYVLCGALTSIAGLMLTARLETGEANIGASMPLESIAACVIGGVSLRGGVGRLSDVVLGAIFIGLVQNGMNLARIDCYLQTVVIGALLILAVVADQFQRSSSSQSSRDLRNEISM